MKANSSNILVLFQIKRLLKERADQDKLFSNKDEEVKKLEGRLHNATSEKSSLQAKLAAAEKELQAAKKSNELLKHKVEDSFHTYMYLYRDYGKRWRDVIALHTGSFHGYRSMAEALRTI